MNPSHSKALRIFRFERVIIPVLLGIGVVLFLIFRDFSTEPFHNIRWDIYSWLWIFIALLLVAIRDLAYMYRIRLLTDGHLTWRRSFMVIMLWEFASAVTPGIVGGSAAAMYILTKEGIRAGRSTAIVLITAMLDELFYIVMVPLVIFLAGTNAIFSSRSDNLPYISYLGMQGIFLIGYSVLLILTLLIFYGVFAQPRGFKMFLIRLFSLPFLRKWRQKAATAGDDIITTSLEMKNKPWIFWAKAFLATVFSWTARFWVVNFIILSITSVGHHLLIYARQLVMWVIMLISPTPGSSGVAEFVFSDFLGDFIPAGLSVPLAFLWRLMSYYPYIIVGSIILPIWVRQTYHRRTATKEPEISTDQ